MISKAPTKNLGWALVLALLIAPRAGAYVDGGTLIELIQENKLGLSRQEAKEALRRLGRKQVDGDLNHVRAARIAAAREFRRTSTDNLANPFDRSSPVTEGTLAYAPSRARGKRVGAEHLPREVLTQESEEESIAKVDIPVSGSCGEEAGRAISDLEDLVRTKVENGLVAGPDKSFFLFLYSLFFNKKMRASIPAVTSGTTVKATAIATYHKGNPGVMTFDCQKYPGLGAVLQRKIVCHELYHKYNFGAGEPAAYAIMSKC